MNLAGIRRAYVFKTQQATLLDRGQDLLILPDDQLKSEWSEQGARGSLTGPPGQRGLPRCASQCGAGLGGEAEEYILRDSNMPRSRVSCTYVGQICMERIEQ